MASCFNFEGLGLLSFLALVPLFLAVFKSKKEKAKLIGFIWGITFFSLLLWWLVPTVSTYGGIHISISCIVILCLCCYLAIYPALWAHFLKNFLVIRPSPFFTILFSSSLWIILEYLRQKILSGFPWGFISYSLSTHPLFIQTADIWGIYGIGFLLLALNAFIALFLNKKLDKNFIIKGILLAAIISFFLFFYGQIRLDEKNDTGLFWGSAVQASIDQSQKWNPSYQDFTVNRYIELTKKAKEKKKGLKLVVWPETSMPFYFQNDSIKRKRVLELAKKENLYILLGSPSYKFTDKGKIRYLNSAYLIGPDIQRLKRYDKQHLVPFGEYMPFGPLTSWARSFLPTAGDFISGKSSSPLSAGPFKIGVMICFESIFPEISRKEVKEGANILSVITNDAWFGKTPAPRQHADMAIFRAIETRRWLIRAANTGISRIISPRGEVVSESRLFIPEFILSKIGLNEDITIYVRFGPYWFLAINFLIVIFGITKSNLKEK